MRLILSRPGQWLTHQNYVIHKISQCWWANVNISRGRVMRAHWPRGPFLITFSFSIHPVDSFWLDAFISAGTFHALFLFEEPVKPHLMSACTKKFVTQINEIVFFQLLCFQNLNSFSHTKQTTLFSKHFHTANWVALPYDSVLHHLPELFVWWQKHLGNGQVISKCLEWQDYFSFWWAHSEGDKPNMCSMNLIFLVMMALLKGTAVLFEHW